jgi:ABC-2 type transport system permease protein
MAQLAAELTPETSWTTAQTRAQFGAIARLRWRITANSFRRKGGGGELAARIITYPIFACLAFLPTVGVGAGAYWFASDGHLDHLSWLLWGTFALAQLLNIQLGQAGTTFDPTQLIRFPLSVGNYIAIRLFFGVLTPANVIASLMSFAIALGVTIAAPSLWLYAFVAMAVFAATNVLFSRMVFAWVDRWLATRRAREIFTGLIFLFSLGIQYLNFTYNPAYNHKTYSHEYNHHPSSAGTKKLNAFSNAYHHAHPYLRMLPPELATESVISAQQGHPFGFVDETLGDAGFAAIFLAIFALRMRSEFRGENLTDAANSVAKPKKPRKIASAAASQRVPLIASPSSLAPVAGAPRSFGINPTSAAQWGKELLYVRRNQGILFALVMPMAISIFLCIRWSSRGSASWVFPAAVAYVMTGLLQLSFNSWGLEGAGSQFYFLAPVRIRDVMFGKNLMSFALAAAEIFTMLAAITYIGQLPQINTIVATILWAGGTLLYSTAMGNQRSLASPKKIKLSATAKKQASPLSGLISLGIMLVATGIGAGVLIASLYFHLQWILVPVFAVYAGGGFFVYNRILSNIDGFANRHREELFLELCKPD